MLGRFARRLGFDWDDYGQNQRTFAGKYLAKRIEAHVSQTGPAYPLSTKGVLGCRVQGLGFRV